MAFKKLISSPTRDEIRRSLFRPGADHMGEGSLVALTFEGGDWRLYFVDEVHFPDDGRLVVRFRAPVYGEAFAAIFAPVPGSGSLRFVA